MAKVEFTDQISVKEWLSGQTHQIKIWFGARCALRLMPGLSEEPDETFDFLTLSSFRAILISAAAATCTAAELKSLDTAIEADFAPTHRSAARFSAFAARSAFAAVSVVADSDAYYGVAAGPASDSPATSADANSPGLWTPIWPNRNMPKMQLGLWTRMKETMQASPEKWAFWLEWYEGILDGKPLPWELSLRIAKEITEEEWDAGPEVVAQRIEEILARFDVERQAKSLEQSAYFADSHTRGIGDNNPPSPIDEYTEDHSAVTIIWAAAHELHEQANAEAPDPNRIERAIALMTGVLKKSGLWALGVVTIGVVSAAKSFGDSVGEKLAEEWIMANSEKITDLIEAAQKLLHVLN